MFIRKIAVRVLIGGVFDSIVRKIAGILVGEMMSSKMRTPQRTMVHGEMITATRMTIPIIRTLAGEEIIRSRTIKTRVGVMITTRSQMTTRTIKTPPGTMIITRTRMRIPIIRARAGAMTITKSRITTPTIKILVGEQITRIPTQITNLRVGVTMTVTASKTPKTRQTMTIPVVGEETQAIKTIIHLEAGEFRMRNRAMLLPEDGEILITNKTTASPALVQLLKITPDRTTTTQKSHKTTSQETIKSPKAMMILSGPPTTTIKRKIKTSKIIVMIGGKPIQAIMLYKAPKVKAGTIRKLKIKTIVAKKEVLTKEANGEAMVITLARGETMMRT